jgi:hypothetical protein
MEIENRQGVSYTESLFDPTHPMSEEDVQSLVAFDSSDLKAPLEILKERGMAPMTSEDVEKALRKGDTFIVKKNLADEIVGYVQFHIGVKAIRMHQNGDISDMADSMHKFAKHNGIKLRT